MSIATTLASLAHVVLLLVRPGVWEAIFGMAAPAHCSYHVVSQISAYHGYVFFILFRGRGINGSDHCVQHVRHHPAILRVLGVGDPFMREDSVDPKFSTGVEIAHITSTRIELGLLTSRGMEITDGSRSRGATGTVTSRQRDSVDLDARTGGISSRRRPQTCRWGI
jgi:hypothetical protein